MGERPFVRSQPTVKPSTLKAMPGHRISARRTGRPFESPSVSCDVFATVHLARFVVAVVRHRAIRKRPAARVDACTRRVSTAARAATDHRASRQMRSTWNTRKAPGQYGNNGADDAAYDAAVIAMRRPNETIRVQWRREDEFGYRAGWFGDACRIDRGTRRRGQTRRLDERTLERSAPEPRPRARVSSRCRARHRLHQPDAVTPPDPAVMLRFSGGRLNSVPAYDIPATRIIGTSDSTHADQGIIAARPRWSAEHFRGGVFCRRIGGNRRARPARIPARNAKRPARPRVVLERVAQLSRWSRRRQDLQAGYGLGIAYDRHRDRGAYCAVVCDCTSIPKCGSIVCGVSRIAA